MTHRGTTRKALWTCLIVERLNIYPLKTGWFLFRRSSKGIAGIDEVLTLPKMLYPRQESFSSCWRRKKSISPWIRNNTRDGFKSSSSKWTRPTIFASNFVNLYFSSQSKTVLMRGMRQLPVPDCGEVCVHETAELFKRQEVFWEEAVKLNVWYGLKICSR